MPERSDTPMRDRMFETRSHVWRAVGLERELTRRGLNRARSQVIIFLPLLIAVVVLYSHRHKLFPGADLPVRIVSVIVLLIVGWAFARAAGRALAPPLFRRMDPGTAGTVGFVIRLATIALSLLVFAWNLFVSLRRRIPAGNDPWGGHTLEWWTTSPPPRHNFDSLPPITSFAPLLDRQLEARP